MAGRGRGRGGKVSKRKPRQLPQPLGPDPNGPRINSEEEEEEMDPESLVTSKVGEIP